MIAADFATETSAMVSILRRRLYQPEYSKQRRNLYMPYHGGVLKIDSLARKHLKGLSRDPANGYNRSYAAWRLMCLKDERPPSLVKPIHFYSR